MMPDEPVVYFTADFLLNPSPGWIVCHDHGDHRKGWLNEPTLIKLEDPGRVWRLTGNRNAAGDYEGRWPD